MTTTEEGNKRYLEHLTNHLIACHRYDSFLKRNFVDMVQASLYNLDVSDMSPETLGKIMCSIDECFLVVNRGELLTSLIFGGSGRNLLADLVSRALAFIIEDRLKDEPKSLLAPYPRKRAGVVRS
jgi:hypothetical protein